MPLRVTNLELPVEEPESALLSLVVGRLGISPDDLRSWRILRKSLDARSRSSLRFVYTVLVELAEEAAFTPRRKLQPGVELYAPEPFEEPNPGRETLPYRPVIVGSGPGGLFAAYYLALRGYQPLVLERGDAVKNRVPEIRSFDRGGPFDAENNYLFGEGGAGTFSDGKLTCRLSGTDVAWVLDRFVELGGKPSLVFEQKPHLGSNRLPMLVRNMRRKIEALGGEYRFRCRVDDLHLSGNQLQTLQTTQGPVSTSVAVLAIGHSARDTYEMLHARGIPFEQKAFQLGLRIEQPQSQVNHHKYGRESYLKILGAADYTLQSRAGCDVFTFCMCAGGIVIPSVSEPGMYCSNGMSNSRHDTPFANSGVMVTLQPVDFPSEHPLAGMHLQREFEARAYHLGRGDYLAPIQLAQDFVREKLSTRSSSLPSSYQRGTIAADLREVLPNRVSNALRLGLADMDRQWRGAFLENATLVGPEMRGSSPVRIARDATTRDVPQLPGVYPVGEGAGYAGGIISAAVDGLRTAKEIVRKYAPPSRDS